jgi:hypothetical protein
VGLERPGIELPVEFAPVLAGASEPKLVVLKGGEAKAKPRPKRHADKKKIA